MTKAQQKVTQYLDEARATEVGLVRELQAQISMTPRGSYRTLLERHLRETRDHADRLGTRLEELDHGSNPIEFAVGTAQQVIGQALALGKGPLNLIRGTGGEEKILKNAKDACATEALEIATYDAIERLASAVGDDATAKLAASIRSDEERMLENVRGELPKLTDAVVRADIDGDPSYDVSKTGAADAIRDTTDDVQEVAGQAATRAKRTTRQARKVPGVARAEGTVKGAVASAADLPIAGYDDRTAEEIVAQLPGLSQIDLAKIEAYERKQQSRSTVLNRISSLRGDEPWPGYDEQTADEIAAAVRDADEEVAAKVRDYERAHKDRTSVLKVSERTLSGVS
jgi:ferritin-like metal-binding protein YciE